MLQHDDGRFFALNANLQPGQFFQTSDGRIFTLALADDSQNVDQLSRDAATADSAEEEDLDAAVIIDDVTRQADNSRQQQPTPSYATSLDRNVAVQRFTSPQFTVVPASSQENVLRFAAAPAAQVSHVEHSFAATDAPAFVRTVAAGPVAHVSHFDHLDHSLAHATAAPAFDIRSAFDSRFLTAAGSPAFVRTAVPHTLAHVSAAPAGVVRTAGNLRGHLLADSATPVFQGFYSFPNAGIDFNF